MSSRAVPSRVQRRIGEADISPEQALLLLFARQILEPEHRVGARRILEGDLSWDLVSRLASWHRLSGLVHEHLNALAPELIPEQLADVRLATTARNLLFQAETERLTELLRQEQIDVVLLKGMALINGVYREAGLREMTDIDLLVREQEIARADRLLRANGYVVAPPYRDPAVIHKMTQEHHHYPALVREDGQAVVELHRHVLPKGHALSFSIDGLWKRAVVVPLREKAGLAPGAADQVMHLAVHFFRNRRYRSTGALGQLCDISETILAHQETADWTILVDYTKSAPLAGPLYCALSATERLLGTSVPNSVLNEIRPAGFTDDILDSFLEYRVLRAQRSLPLELLRPTKHPLRRVFPARERFADVETSLPSAYLRRVRVALRLLTSLVLHPRQVLRDLRLNRFLRSLYENGPH